MYINTFRLLAFIVLFAIIIIVEIPFKKLFKDPTIQLYIAVLCIAILMLLDNISGFILTIGILIIYFRIYTDEIKNKRERENMENIYDTKDTKDTKDIKDTKDTKDTKDIHNIINEEKGIKDMSKEKGQCDKNCDKCSIEMPNKKNIFNELAIDNFVPYITEENLLAAQTNIIDVNNYNLCINNKDIEILEVKRGPLCDIQGLQDIPDLGDNRILRGYDVYNSRLGNLTYDIL